MVKVEPLACTRDDGSNRKAPVPDCGGVACGAGVAGDGVITGGGACCGTCVGWAWPGDCAGRGATAAGALEVLNSSAFCRPTSTISWLARDTSGARMMCGTSTKTISFSRCSVL